MHAFCNQRSNWDGVDVVTHSAVKWDWEDSETTALRTSVKGLWLGNKLLTFCLVHYAKNGHGHVTAYRRHVGNSWPGLFVSFFLSAALQKQLPGTTHIVFSGTLKKWLKYAPEREGGGGRRTNERDQVGLCTLVPHTMRPSTDERRECDSEPWTGLNGRTQNAFRERNAMEPVSCHNSNLKKKVSKGYTLKFNHL